MKKVLLKEISYNKLKEILTKELNSINEISYGTVDKAREKSDDIFHSLIVSFENFYEELREAKNNVEFNGDNKPNQHLEEIEMYANAIYNILQRKKEQENNFYDEINKVDNKKFHSDENQPSEWEDNMDNLDLRMLQAKYPKQ